MFQKIPQIKSLAARISLLSFLWITLLMFISGVAISWAFNRSAERSLDNQLLAYIDILISSTLLTPQGKVYLQDDASVISTIPRYWQITVDGVPLVKSPHMKSWIKVKSTAGNAVERLYITDRFGTEITAVQKTIVFPGNMKVVYVFGMQSAIAKAFVDEEKGIFARALIFILVPVALLLLVLAWIQIKLQKKPLEDIRHRLEDVYSGKASRLQGEFPTEIEPLANQVNILLDYSEGMVNRYRTFASNLSHALKTPLSVISLEASKLKEQHATTIKEQTHLMSSLIERNLARVKSAGTGNILTARTPINDIINKITRGYQKIYQREIELDLEQDLFFKGEEGDSYELLGNIIENACKFAHHKVRVTAKGNECITLIIEDDGSGIDKEDYEKVLKRGTRLDESTPGQGIGLPIARDLVELYNGTIELGKSHSGGLSVTITLPRAR